MEREKILTRQNDSLRARINQLNNIIQKHQIDFNLFIDQQKKFDSGLETANNKLIDNAVENQRLRDKAKNISISLQVGYDPFTGKPYAGFGAGFDIWRF